MAWFDRPSGSLRVGVSSVENDELRKLADLLVMTDRLGKSAASEILTTCIRDVKAAISPSLQNEASSQNRPSF